MKPKITIIRNKVYINGKKAILNKMENGDYCRKTFYNDRYFVKFSPPDEYYNSFNQSEHEAFLWKRIDEEDKKYFGRFILINKKSRFIVFERVYPKNYMRSERAMSIIYKLCSKYGISDVSNHPSNWAMIDEDFPVILDYGYSSEYY